MLNTNFNNRFPVKGHLVANQVPKMTILVNQKKKKLTIMHNLLNLKYKSCFLRGKINKI